MYACMYACKHATMFTYMYVCTYACTYLHMHVRMYDYLCMYVSMYVCMYVRMYVCMYIHTYICMYVCVFATLFRVPSQNQRVVDAHKCGFGKICGSICLDFRTHIPNPLLGMLSNCRGPCSPDYGCCTLCKTSRPCLPEIAATEGGASCKRLHCTQGCARC